MSAVDLPVGAWPDSASPRLLDFGFDLTPPNGGAMQRYGRLGARYAVSFSLPQLDANCGGAVLGALLEARTLGAPIGCWFPNAEGLLPYGDWDVVLDFVGSETEDGSAYLSAPQVAGASQTGTSLDIEGAAGTIPAGTFFSVVVSSVSYLYCNTRPIPVADDGTATLNLAPQLRVSPADAAPLLFGRPRIEGFTDGSEQGWTLDRLMSTFDLPLSLTERK